MEAEKRRLRRAVCTTTQGRRPTHAWGERAAMFTFQVDTKPMGVLSMLQQEPGAAVGLLTCSAGVGGWFLLTCHDREKNILVRTDSKCRITLLIIYTLSISIPISQNHSCIIHE